MLTAFALAAFQVAVTTYAVPVVGLICTLYVLYVGGRKLTSVLRSQDYASQLEAKNEIIRTNEQTIESFRARVLAFEEDFARMVESARQADEAVRKAEETVKRLQIELHTLEQYAAPEAVQRFEAMVRELRELVENSSAERDRRFDEIAAALKRIEALRAM